MPRLIRWRPTRSTGGAMAITLASAAALVAALVLTQSPPAARAASSDQPAPYTETIPGTKVSFDMVPIPGGTFKMGSPDSEAMRKDDEGPQHEVTIEPFWMGKFEVTWAEYGVLVKEYQLIKAKGDLPIPPDKAADAVSVPTPIYPQEAVPIYDAMGWGPKHPVSDMTQFAAKQYTKWLSKKTGHFYRLPTEAEWEYAARAGSTTAYFFGDDPDKLGDYAWFSDNAIFKDPAKGHPDTGSGYRQVGLKKPNAWGLYDVYGNVGEWVIDQYVADHYAKLAGKTTSWLDAIAWPTTEYPRVVRGGSWDSFPEECRSASRFPSNKAWKKLDPQIPKSVWWNTNGFMVGLRIIRPMKEPSAQEKLKFWEADVDIIRDVLREDRKQARTIIEPPAPK